METEKINESISELEKALVNPQATYSLDDKNIIITTTYKNNDEILKAIAYFKSLQIQPDILPEVETE